MTRCYVAFVALALMIGLAACDHFVDISLKAGATSSQLNFVIVQGGNSNRPVDLLRWVLVQRCQSGRRPPLWGIQTRGHNTVTDFTYGKTPIGWSLYKGAEPLTAGCYYVHAQGPGTIGSRSFKVDSLGRIVAQDERN